MTTRRWRAARSFGAAILVAATAAPREASAKTLFDYFTTTPVINNLSSPAAWGASRVAKRDQDNGLEDRTMAKWSYWDGRIVKAADGKYHLVARLEQRGREARPLTRVRAAPREGVGRAE